MSEAQWALIISGFAAGIALAGFIFQIVRWRSEGPRLKVTVRTSVLPAPAESDAHEIVTVNLVNRGRGAITVFWVLLAYGYLPPDSTRLRQWRWRWARLLRLPIPGQGGVLIAPPGHRFERLSSEFPKRLEAGDVATMVYERDLVQRWATNLSGSDGPDTMEFRGEARHAFGSTTSRLSVLSPRRPDLVQQARNIARTGRP